MTGGNRFAAARQPQALEHFPPGDLGNGSFTYTAAEGWTIDFDSSGKQTAWTSNDGYEVLSYTYTSSKLTGFTSIDSAVATLTYSNGSGTLLSSIATPGSRTWNFTHSGTDLTTITDPDSKTHTFGTYANHKPATERTIRGHRALFSRTSC